MKSSNTRIPNMFLSSLAASLLLMSPAMALDSNDALTAANDVGAYNELTLLNEGNDNQAFLLQAGELNSLSLLIQANNVSVDILQQGSANLVAGMNGSPEFILAGHNSRLDIIQNGIGNQVFGMQLSANSSINVTQLGSGNSATVIQR